MKSQFIFTVISGFLVNGLLAQSVSIDQVPAEILVQVGDTFEVEVLMDVNAQTVSVFDLHLRFDSEYIQPISVETIEEGFVFHLTPDLNEAQGKIDMAAMKFNATPMDGAYTAATLRFIALAPTEETYLYHPMNAFPKTLVAFGGEDLLSAVGDTKIVILPGEALSIEENKAELDLEIYPNPTAGMAFIELKLPKTGRLELEIFDATGKLIESVFSGELQQGESARFEVDLSVYADGIYTCSIRVDNALTNRKLVVTK